MAEDHKSKHLIGRCGTCGKWSEETMGGGRCMLPNETSSPMSLSDPGALYTRIDFGCRWYQLDEKFNGDLSNSVVADIAYNNTYNKFENRR